MASWAGRNRVRCVIRKPLAMLRIFLWRLRAGTLRFTRGISVLVLHVRRRPSKPPCVLAGQHQQLADLKIAPRALVHEQMALLRVWAHDLSGLGHPEPLGRRAMGTQFRHRSLLSLLGACARAGG